MKNIMIFENTEVEIIELNGKALFNANDIAKCLDIKNVNDNITRMNEKQVVKLTNSDIGESDFRKLNNAGENFLTESGVYKLIFKSNKSNAEKFQDWITDEVLPAIRKTGSYSLPKPMSAMELLELQYKALQETRTEMKQMVEEVKEEIHDFQKGISGFKEEIIEFKEEMPLLAVEIEKITKAKNRAIVDILGGKYSNAYKDRSLRGMVYSDLQKELSRQFGVKSYKAIRRNECDKALELIANYKPPLYLKREIDNANNQLRL